MRTRVEIPVEVTAKSWYAVVRAHNQIVSSPGEIELDASATERVEPFGATILALAVARRELAGLAPVAWVPPHCRGCVDFLEEIAFPLYVTGTRADRENAKWHDTLEMRQVHHLDPSYLFGLADLLVRLVPGTSTEMSHVFQLCLSELVTNVRDHAASPVGCFILARWHREQENVRIAIADAGDTIPGVLRGMPRYAHEDDRRLLHAAVMKEGVTSRERKMGGLGLKNIRDIALQREGGLIVVSGSAKLEVRGAADSPRVSLRNVAPAFKGTAIEIDFRPGVEVDVSGEEVF